MRAVAVACVGLLVVGCGGPLEPFDVPISQSGVLPGLSSSIPGGGGVDLGRAGAQVKQTIENKGFGPITIRSTTLTKAELVLVQPANSSLAWLAGLRIFVSAPGLPRVAMAHIDDVQGDGPNYPLVIDGVELAPYVSAESLTFEPVFDTPQTRPFSDHEVRLDLTLRVEADWAAG